MNEDLKKEKEFWKKTKINPPFPSTKEIKEAEHLFKDYIFFEDARLERQLTTTCCGRNTKWQKLQRTMTVNDTAISYGIHNQTAKCPFCGREVTLKNIKRSGKRKNLKECKNVLFLTERKGTLYAIAANGYRGYEKVEEPTHWTIYSVYSFNPADGVKEEYRTYCSNIKTGQIKQSPGEYNFRDRSITDPFGTGSYMSMSYAPYYIVGYENKDKTFAKYCMFEKFNEYAARARYTSEFIRYMALFTAYPRLVEMFMKTGFSGYVFEAFYFKKKNATLINWDAKTPKEVFKLSQQEIRQMIELKASPSTMQFYKKLRKLGKVDVKFAKELRDNISQKSELFIELCRKTKSTPQKAWNYVNKFTGAMCGGRGKRRQGQVLLTWRDYLDACEFLGYDLEAVKMPRNLDLKHNEATAERQRILELQEAKKERAAMRKFKASLKKREIKYNFSYGGYTVRVAKSRKEILDEGRILSHCVGGYASRHIENKLTILFLRPDSDPDTPYVTIEMNGNRLIQAHGFRNECDGAEAPKEKHKNFFEKWLTWIEAGSKRDETGKPIIQKKKRKKVKKRSAMI